MTYNWEEIAASLVERTVKEQSVANTLSSEQSLHCWTEVFVLGRYAYKVEGTFSSDEVKVFYDKPLVINDFTPTPWHMYLLFNDMAAEAWKQLILEGRIVL
jgi:hypothetical protein